MLMPRSPSDKSIEAGRPDRLDSMSPRERLLGMLVVILLLLLAILMQSL